MKPDATHDFCGAPTGAPTREPHTGLPSPGANTATVTLHTPSCRATHLVVASARKPATHATENAQPLLWPTTDGAICQSYPPTVRARARCPVDQHCVLRLNTVSRRRCMDDMPATRRPAHRCDLGPTSVHCCPLIGRCGPNVVNSSTTCSISCGAVAPARGGRQQSAARTTDAARTPALVGTMGCLKGKRQCLTSADASNVGGV